MPIPQFTVVPSRDRPATFSADANSLLGELPAFVDAVNAAAIGESAAGLALSLNGTGTSEGGDIVSVARGTDYGTGKAGFLLVRAGRPVSLFDAFSSKAEVAAVKAKSSTSDHQSILADVFGNESSVLVPYGRFNGSAAISITSKLQISGHEGCELRFTDGAYTALRFTTSAAQLSSVRGVYMRGTNTSTPAITLLKFDTEAAYNKILCNRFAYASKALDMDGVYVTKMIGNEFSNCDVYWTIDDTTFGVADVYCSGNTYGTSTIGSAALVQIAAPGVRLLSEYWETQQHAKASLALNTGAQTVEVDGRFEASGEVLVQTSVEAWLKLRANDSYSAAGNRFLRVDASANAYLNHSQIRLGTLDATKTAVSGAGGVVADMIDISKFGTGLLMAGTGAINSGQIRGCTTGVQFNSGSTASLGRSLSFVGNTTNVVNNSGGTAIAPGSFTGTLTGCTTSPTGTFRYEVDNGLVTLSVPGITGTSNSTSCTITGLPAAIQPTGAVFTSACGIVDAGVNTYDSADVTGGTLTLRKGGGTTGFTNTGTKGVQACVITYRLRSV